MISVYIDESGDTGITKKSSEYFIFSVFISDNDQFLTKKILRKAKNKLIRGNKKTNYTFHANENKSEVKKFLLNEFRKNNLRFLVLIFKKSNFLEFKIEFAFEKLKEELNKVKPHEIVFAQRETNKNKNQKIFKILDSNNVYVKMSRPNNAEGLQVSDLISWTVFQKYENTKTDFYDLIKDNIKEVIIKK